MGSGEDCEQRRRLDSAWGRGDGGATTRRRRERERAAPVTWLSSDGEGGATTMIERELGIEAGGDGEFVWMRWCGGVARIGAEAAARTDQKW
ncbi:hypothetical protein M0R45_002028 [Rubus argutus]|uniref:Uncharacterized protein n=1 Tax=Rubus argutus TaxID=59490 RepID=A0AAW1VEQ0_RUBAR